MVSGRSLSVLSGIAAMVLAIAAALSIPSTANAQPFGGPCVRITMVSADAAYKLHLVNQNSARLGLHNRQVGSSVVVKTPESIGIMIDHTGEVKWEQERRGNGQIGFEDHIDDDYNDAVIRVEPVSCPSSNSGSASTVRSRSTPRPAPTATPRPEPTATPRPEPTATPAPRSNRRSAQGSSGIGGAAKPSNRAPQFTEGRNANRYVAENAANPGNVGNPVTATDADGDTLIYTLGGPDAAAFTLDSGTGQLKTAIALDYETKAVYHVIVNVYDARGGRDIIVVNIRVTDVAEPPVVIEPPVAAPEPQPVQTLAPEPTETPTPTPTATPTPEPTETPTPAPAATPAATPEPTAPLWPLWQTATPASMPAPSSTLAATPESSPTQEPTADPEDTSGSRLAMFVEFQGGGPLGDSQSASVKSSVSPLPEESLHLRIWPLVLMAIGIVLMVVSIGMLISGGPQEQGTGNRDFIMNR